MVSRKTFNVLDGSLLFRGGISRIKERETKPSNSSWQTKEGRIVFHTLVCFG